MFLELLNFYSSIQYYVPNVSLRQIAILLHFMNKVKLTHVESPLFLTIHETNGSGIVIHMNIPIVPRNRSCRVPIHETVPCDYVSVAVS